MKENVKFIQLHLFNFSFCTMNIYNVNKNNEKINKYSR